MLLPFVAVITDAKKTDWNHIGAAIGWGPETFTPKLCAISPSATPATPPTHWLCSAAAATDSDVAMLQAMTHGDLPQPANGAVWGVDGVIAADEAMAASDGSVFHVYSVAGNIEPAEHVSAVLATEGLQYVPEPEI